MKDWALFHLRCPACKWPLEQTVFESADEVSSGYLICRNQTCRAWYPIVRGIPRMLPESLRLELTHQFVHEHRAALVSDGLIQESGFDRADDLHSLKQHTIQNFGFEWLEYARFGWDDPVYNIQREERVFRGKSLLSPEDIKSKLVLDAGCGNGRYSYWAAKYGAQVIGVDLGDGVESAAQNTVELPDVQVVQGDIFNLPFADQTFDVIFSIGVLMHTGDARRATGCLAKTLKSGGSLTIHVYGKGNPVYEFVDRILRNRTTRMSIPELQRFTAKAYQGRRQLERWHVAGLVERFVRLDPHPHCIFDWYAAPIATHHTYAEVTSWFSELGLEIVKTNAGSLSSSLMKRVLHPLFQGPSTVTVRGISTIKEGR